MRSTGSPLVYLLAVLVPLLAIGAPVMAGDTGFSIGNLVWEDVDNDGLFNGAEVGIDGVTVELRSADGTSLLASSTTASGGLYSFNGLTDGTYVVRLPAVNFNPGGILRDYRSSTGLFPDLAYEPAPDPDIDTTDSDDNGTETNGLLGLGGYVESAPVTISGSARPDADFAVNKSPQIDLVVTKSDGQTTYLPGETLSYTVVVTNNGPVDANGMTISDTRPSQIASWTWTCAPGTPAEIGCTGSAANPATFTDSLDLASPLTNYSVTYTVSAQVAAVVSGDLVNTVFVVPPQGMTDITPQDNIATDTDSLAGVDLSVAKTDNQTVYAAGGTITYAVTVANGGPAAANGLTVSDARPSQITSWTWACAVGTPPAYACTADASNPPTFTDSLDLPALASVTYEVTAQVSASPTGDLTNSVTVTAPADVTELDTADDSAVDVDSLAGTTLSSTKAAAPDPVLAGDLLTYTVLVSNSGVGAASTVSVEDTLPGGVSFVSASGDGWTCGESSGVVTCTRPTLAPGAAPAITIVVSVSDALTSLTNVATVSAANAPATEASIESRVIVPVPTASGLGLLLLALAVGAAATAMLHRRR